MSCNEAFSYSVTGVVRPRSCTFLAIVASGELNKIVLKLEPERRCRFTANETSHRRVHSAFPLVFKNEKTTKALFFQRQPHLLRWRLATQNQNVDS